MELRILTVEDAEEGEEKLFRDGLVGISGECEAWQS
jgi:hypothetical protein